MRRPIFAAAAVAAILASSVCDAALIVYQFESPQFTLGQTTPLLNEPPDASGPPTVTTSFTDTVNANGYAISNIHENGLMVGQALFEAAATSALTLVFNTPMIGFAVDFAIDTPTATPGFLRLVTSSGTVNQVASAVGGGNGFPGGTLSFNTSTPFTSATLQGFVSGGTASTQIEIDNLRLTTAAVPEPATLALLTTGVLGLAASRRRKTK